MTVSIFDWINSVCRDRYRPYIAFAEDQLCRNLGKSSEQQWNAVIRVLRYLYMTEAKGICNRINPGDLKLSAFGDADRRSDKDNRLSTSRVMVMVDGSLVISKSKLLRVYH